jgi:FKBP-type peptidyl-prolyl cis-trans isomerase
MHRVSALLLLGVLSAAPAWAADTALGPEANKAYLDSNAKKAGVTVVPGIQYRVVKSGSGAQPGHHDCVTVNYKGSLINGSVFDQTHGTPASFEVGGVIAGWTQVLQMMHVGDDWEVTIPAGLAYGKAGAGDGVIPPDQTLIFDIQLLAVDPPGPGGCG